MVKTKRSTIKEDNLEHQLQEIMSCFDFDQVLEYMNWDKSRRTYDDYGNCIGKSTWKVRLDNNRFEVPSLSELKQFAKKQLEEVIARYRKNGESYYYIRSGPFKSTCRYGILELECVIESWSDD